MASPLLDQLLNDIKQAMKAKDKQTLLALRTLHSEIKNVGIEAKRDVTDEDVSVVVARAIKQRNDAIAQFRDGGRDDLVVKEQAQIDLYRNYQPKQLDRAELEALIDQAIEEVGAETRRDMGKVMKTLMPKVKGKADNKLVSQIVSGKLGLSVEQTVLDSAPRVE